MTEIRYARRCIGHVSNFFSLASMILFTTSSLAVSGPISDPSGLDAALVRGDRGAVTTIENRISVGPVTKSINGLQLSYDMPKLLDRAKSCESGAFKAGVLESALRCNTIARGVALVALGDVHEYLAQSAWAKDTLFPAIRAKPGARASFGNALDDMDITSLAASTPTVTQKVLTESKNLEFVSPKGAVPHPPPPAVTISINGHEVPAFVDSGTPVNMIVTRSLSKSLGLTKVLEKFAATQYMGRAGEGSLSDVYMAKTVIVGPLELHNLLIGVVPDSEVPSGIYIGMAMLRRFNEVTIDNKQIVLSMRRTEKCSMPIPMTFASDISQSGKLLFNVQANMRSARAELDTGSSFLLLGSSHFFPYTITDALHYGQVGEASINVYAGSESLTSGDAIVLSAETMHEGTDVIIGNPVLEAFKLVLHLRDPALCLISTTRPE